jgi:cytochrome b subunit of formate dehydrogenase
MIILFRAQGAKLQVGRHLTQRLMHFCLIIAAALAIAGGIELNYPAHYNLVLTLRKVSPVLFAVFYVLFVLLHAYY